MKTNLSSITQSFIFSSKCVLCSQVSQHNNLCLQCRALLPYAENYCVVCGLPLAHFSLNNTRCGQCLQGTRPFNRTVATFWYQEPIQILLNDYKFGHKLFLARVLASLMAEKIFEYYNSHQLAMPHCLIPVPLHSSRLAERGYNQAGELTKYLSRLLGVRYSQRYCKRIVATQPQATILAPQRVHNVKNSFRSYPIPYSSIAIIDDILTTGHTVTELSRQFRIQGVSDIHVWCCARTLL